MSQRELIGFAVGLAVVLPLSALIGKFVILWIGGIRVPFVRVLISTTVAYVLTFALGWFESLVGVITPESNGLRLLTGLGILTVCHINLSRPPTGDRLSPMKAIFASVLQVVGGIVAFFGVMLLGLALKTVFA